MAQEASAEMAAWLWRCWGLQAPVDVSSVCLRPSTSREWEATPCPSSRLVWELAGPGKLFDSSTSDRHEGFPLLRVRCHAPHAQVCVPGQNNRCSWSFLLNSRLLDEKCFSWPALQAHCSACSVGCTTPSALWVSHRTFAFSLSPLPTSSTLM